MSHHHHCHCHSHGASCCGGMKKEGCCCHHHESCAGCGSGQSCCHSGKCDYKNKFLALADEAWMEVLKEKIKEEIRKNSSHLDELARLISESNKEVWRHKMEGHRTMGSYEEKMMQFFNCSSHSCGNKDHHSK